MTYGLISDIHGNLEALKAVLAELAGVDGFVCLGDTVGYGPDPGRCAELLRELPNLTCVSGNHDLAAIGRYDLEWFNPFAQAAIKWTSEQLSPEHKAYLSSLPLTAHVDKAVLVHGSLPDEMAYITTPEEARSCFDAMPGDLVFIGHTHVAEYYRARGNTRFPEQVSLSEGGHIAFESELRYVVNPGAIGQPRDGNPAAAFGIWDVAAGTVETRRVAYDIESAQEKMRRANLPGYLIERLSVGR